VTRSGTLNQWSSRSNGVMHSDRLAEKTKRAAAYSVDIFSAGIAYEQTLQEETYSDM